MEKDWPKLSERLNGETSPCVATALVRGKPPVTLTDYALRRCFPLLWKAAVLVPNGNEG